MFGDEFMNYTNKTLLKDVHVTRSRRNDKIKTLGESFVERLHTWLSTKATFSTSGVWNALGRFTQSFLGISFSMALLDIKGGSEQILVTLNDTYISFKEVHTQTELVSVMVLSFPKLPKFSF